MFWHRKPRPSGGTWDCNVRKSEAQRKYALSAKGLHARLRTELRAVEARVNHYQED